MIEVNPEPDKTTPLDWLPTYHMVPMFSKDECKQIINDAIASGQFAPGRAIDEHGNAIEHEGRRVSILRLAGGSLFNQIRDRVLERLPEINSRYDFDLFDADAGLFNEVHILRYSEGHFHGNHLDLAPYGGMANRKLSFVAQLNSEYTGGALILYNASHDVPFKPGDETVGQAAIFPSWIPHMVHPVESGERFTIVIWLLGPRFR